MITTIRPLDLSICRSYAFFTDTSLGMAFTSTSYPYFTSGSGSSYMDTDSVSSRDIWLIPEDLAARGVKAKVRGKFSLVWRAVGVFCILKKISLSLNPIQEVLAAFDFNNGLLNSWIPKSPSQLDRRDEAFLYSRQADEQVHDTFCISSGKSQALGIHLIIPDLDDERALMAQ